MESALFSTTAQGWDLIETDDDDKAVIYNEETDFVDIADGEADDIFEESGTPSIKLFAPIVGEDSDLQRLASDSAVYGVTVEDADTDMGGEHGGLIYYCKILRNGYKNKYIIDKAGNLKGRRPIPQVYADDFFNSLTKTKEGSWVFNGRLNGWPALTRLELLSLEYHYQKKQAKFSKRFWKKSAEGKQDPQYPKPGYGFFKVEPKSIRAKLRAPAWTEVGYSKDNPGFVWYYSQFREGGARLAHGENIIAAVVGDSQRTGKPIPKAVRAHFFGHRYVKKKKQLKDPIEYHTGVLLEWDHGQYCTVLELAWLMGTMGRSNWLDDSGSKKPELYKVMPGCIKSPWFTTKNEIRIIDVEAKNLQEFEAYMQKYEKKRFLKPNIKYSGDVRISANSLDWIARYVLNYQLRDQRYSEKYHNCQSFAADLYSFLCAKVSVTPYVPVNSLYKQKRHMFLYKPEMFKKANKELSKKSERSLKKYSELETIE
mmetsp:Transcript_12179/g.14774  ORF Transcript_12179/g.14774 Transcript_12179/m.14774 type:complete len:483 (+) Transcript_12179:120-1568(+)